jgi:hypothetical protein
MPRLNAGMVGLEVQVNNQDGKTVMKGRWTLLVLNQP